MARIKTHMEDCEYFLGKPFKEVHIWLDKYAKEYPPSIYYEYHRGFRHNAKGVKEIEEKFGFYATIAAKIHIIRDNEVYILEKMMYNIKMEEIDDLYKKALKYNEDWHEKDKQYKSIL